MSRLDEKLAQQARISRTATSLQLSMPKLKRPFAPLLGCMLFQVARVLKLLGQTRTAGAAYLRSGELGFRPHVSFLRAAIRAEEIRIPGFVTTRNSIEHRSQPDFATSSLRYRQSLDARPTAQAAFRLGVALRACGDISGATSAFEHAVALSPENAKYWYELGKSKYSLGMARTGFTAEEIAECECAFRQALLLSPLMSAAEVALIRLLIRAAAWEKINDLLRPKIFLPEAVKPDNCKEQKNWHKPRTLTASNHVETLLKLFNPQKMPPRSVVQSVLQSGTWRMVTEMPREAWLPLHWRMLSMGWFTEAYMAKDLHAELIATGRKKRYGLPRQHLTELQGLVYLGQSEEALSRLKSMRAASNMSLADSALWHRLYRDINLNLGDISPASVGNWPRERRIDTSGNGMGNQRIFADLISGARIAIVGPSETGLRMGREIDDADVVIRTHLLDFETVPISNFGSRTDIVYPALTRSVHGQHLYSQALRSKELKMLVLRPGHYNFARAQAFSESEFRYNRNEYIGSFYAAQFGIQRIIHDVLKFSPAKVTIFGTTLFIPFRNLYFKQYNDDTFARRASSNFVPPLHGFAHDYLADFVFTKLLIGAGLIDADDALMSIVDMTTTEYLATLDR